MPTRDPYKIVFPDTYHNKAVSNFLTEFYKISDRAPPSDKPDPYVEAFSPDAYVKIGPNEAIDSETLTANRKKMWIDIAKRQHTIYKAYPFTKDTEEIQEIVLYGAVEYTKTDGSQVAAEWTGVFTLNVKGDEVKGTEYRVHIGPKPTLLK